MRFEDEENHRWSREVFFGRLWFALRRRWPLSWRQVVRRVAWNRGESSAGDWLVVERTDRWTIRLRWIELSRIIERMKIWSIEWSKTFNNQIIIGRPKWMHSNYYCSKNLWIRIKQRISHDTLNLLLPRLLCKWLVFDCKYSLTGLTGKIKWITLIK